MAIPVIIIEDNRLAVKALANLLEEHQNLEVVGTANSLAEGKRLINDLRPSLIFLDVELPDGNGVEFWNEIKSKASWYIHVIFYSAHQHYAIEALRAEAHDYLVKPVDADDLNEAVKRFYLKSAETLLHESRMAQEHESSENIILVVDEMNNKIAMKTENIGLFSYASGRKIWEAHCYDGNIYSLRYGLKASKVTSVNPHYVQVHKSYIVNVSYISRIEEGKVFMMPPFDKVKEITVGKLYRSDLFDHFCQL